MVYFDLYLPDSLKIFLCSSVTVAAAAAVTVAAAVAVAVGFIGFGATILKLQQSEVVTLLCVDFA